MIGSPGIAKGPSTTKNIGAGILQPGARVHVYGNSDDSSNDCTLRIEDADTTVQSRLPQIEFYGNGTLQNTIRSSDDFTVLGLEILDSTGTVYWQFKDGGAATLNGTVTCGGNIDVDGTSATASFRVRFRDTGGQGTDVWSTDYAVGDSRLYVSSEAGTDVVIGNGNVECETFTSTQTTGTAPITVASTTLVSNLNADLLDGNEASAFATASHTHSTSDITSGTFADARIAASNVTQHQASLSIPISTGVSGLGTSVATFLGTPSSANLAAAVTDETGSGSLVFATSPALTTPVLGVASATSLACPTYTTSSGAMGFTPATGSGVNWTFSGASARMSITATADAALKITAPQNHLEIVDSDDSQAWRQSANSGLWIFEDETAGIIPFALKSPANGNYTLFVDGPNDRIGVKTSSPAVALDVNSDSIRVRTSQTPASAAASGSAGTICWDSGYIYVCTATNTWKRVAIATW